MNNKKKIMKYLIIIAVIIIPVMYSFFYLKAFWNPYGNLEDLSVAVINLDKESNTENLGDKLVEELKKNNTVNFVFLDNAEEAMKGLEEEKYYATITIPENFTKDLNSANSTEKTSTSITYSPNQKYNYLASQIINQITTKIELNLRSEVSGRVVEELADNIDNVSVKLEDVASGAGKIADGTENLNEGLETLKTGTNSLEVNYNKFDKGINQIYNGSDDLEQGINELNNGLDKVLDGTEKLDNATNNISDLKQGINTLSTASNNLNSGINNYVNGTNQVVDSVSKTKKQIEQLGSDIQKYINANPQVMQDENIQKIIEDLQVIQNNNQSSELNTLVTSGEKLKQGANELNIGINTFSDKASSFESLKTGISSLNLGMKQLKEGANQVQTGGTSLNAGIKEIKENSSMIFSGIKTLNNGTNTALKGSEDLNQGVTTFKNEIDNGVSQINDESKKLEGLDDFVEEPVTIKEEDYAKVDSYGVGFAPYFISISLWVGALVALVMFYGDEENRFKHLGKFAKNKYLRIILYIGISAIQGIVLGFLLKLGLGYNVTNTLLYYGIMILIGITFMSIEYFLIINFGDVGKFLCIFILVLQLAASAGTFPIETVPKIFQNLYPLMPANYTIKLIKEVLVELNKTSLIKNISIIISILIVFFSLNNLFEYIKSKIKNEQKQEKLES